MHNKNIILIFLTLLLINNKLCIGQNNPLDPLNFLGKVKSLKEIGYYADEKFGEILKSNVYNNEFLLFNTKGNIESIYDENGLLIRKFVYKYDSKGNKIEESQYNTDGSLEFKHASKYDSIGNLIEVSTYRSNGDLLTKTLYKYDKKGNKIEECFYNYDGTLNTKSHFKYDLKGNVIEDKSLNYNNPDGSPNGKFNYKYTYINESIK